MDLRFARVRRGLIGDRYGVWLCLLVLAQATDVLTSAAGMARGTVEANWIAAHILALGGLMLLWLVKLLIVLGVGLAALMTRAYGRMHPGRKAEILQWMILRGTQLSVVALTLISINNLIQAFLV